MHWDDVAERLRAHEPERLTLDAARPAAVMVLFDAHDPLELILTKRASHLKKHAGQISFPGGGREPGDPDLEFTARRECAEELGIDHEGIEVVGHLRDFHVSVSGYLVRPYVGRLVEATSFSLQVEEVDSLLRVSLQDALATERWETMSLRGRERAPVLRIGEERVWGATAYMLRHFISVLGDED